MSSKGRDTSRTSDGHLTMRALRSGSVESLGWKIRGNVHLLRLGLFRFKPDPALLQVEHFIIHHPDGEDSWQEVHRELFDDVRKARSYMERVRRETPDTYDIPLEDP